MVKPLLFDVRSLLKNSIYKKNIKSLHLTDQFHFHNTYEIDYIAIGAGRRIVGDNIDTYSDGDLIILPPFMPHANYSENLNDGINGSTKQTTYATVVYFLPDWINEKHIESAELTTYKILLHNISRGIKVFGETKSKIIQLLPELKNGAGVESMIVMLKILSILSNSADYSLLASKSYLNSSYINDVDRIDRVYKYVMHNFQDKIILSEIAEVVHMTSTAFCKFFKQKTNKTFSNFVNEIRITHACKLILNTTSDMNEICYKSGFNNIASFNKNFRKFTKMTPTEYRLSLKPVL